MMQMSEDLVQIMVQRIVEQRGNLVGSVLRSALREGKVLYERA
jgi:hypothetical protein